MKSPLTTPDNPSELGWSATDIKEHQWKPFEILYKWTLGLEEDLIAYIYETQYDLEQEIERAKNAEGIWSSASKIEMVNWEEDLE